jgi:hypothetical protein
MRVNEGGARKPEASTLAAGQRLNLVGGAKAKPKAKLNPRTQYGAREREKDANRQNAERRQARLLEPDADVIKAAEGLSGFQLQARVRSLTERPGDKGTKAAFTFASIAQDPKLFTSIVSPRKLREVQQEIGSWRRQDLDLSFVPSVPVLEDDERSQALAVLKAVGKRSDPEMSDPEILKELQKPDKGTLLGDIVTRTPADLAETLVGLPVGAATLGYAAGKAVRGDTDPIKQVAGSTVDWYGDFAADPIGTLREHPAQVAANVILPAKGIAGRGITKLTRPSLERGALDLPTIGARIPAQQRPTFSGDAFNRAVQRGNDWRIARSPRASAKALAKSVRSQDDMFRAQGYQARDRALAELNEVKATKNEKLAAWALAQGVKPSEMAAYYTQRALDPANAKNAATLRGQARLFERVAKSTNDGATEGAHAARGAMRAATRKREEGLDDAGLLTDEMRTERPNIVRDEMGGTAPGDPFYVKHVGRGRGFGGFVQGRGTKPLRNLEKETQHRNELRLIQSGRANPEWDVFRESIARVPTLQARVLSLRDFLETHGMPARPGERYDPDAYVALKVDADFGNATQIKPDTLKPALAKQLKEQRAGQKLDADDAQIEQDLLRDTLEAKHTNGNVPDDGVGYVLVPKSGWEAITKPRRGESFVNTKGGRVAEMMTGAWRFATLGLRPGYILPNTAGIAMQGMLGGTGPLSFIRAARPKFKDVAPDRIKHSTFAGNMGRVTHAGRFGEGRVIGGVRETFQSPLDFRNAPIDSVLRAPLRAPYRGMHDLGSGVINTVAKFDGFVRRAQYLHDAIPAAKRSANGSRFSKLGNEVMDELAKGKQRFDTGDPTVGADWAVPVGEKLTRFLGDFSKGTNRTLNTFIPFSGWYGFILKQTLKDLPLEHPVRFALLTQVAMLGNETRQKMGLDAIDAPGALPVDASDPENATIARTQAWTPWGTVPDLFKRDPSGTQLDFRRLPTGVLNPLASAAASSLQGRDIETGIPLRDAQGNALDGSGFGFNPPQTAGEWAKTLVNQLAYTLPIASLMVPQRGHSNESILGFGEDDMPAPKSERQPERSFEKRLFGYLTGIQLVAKDLPLQQRQALAHLVVPDGAPPEMEELIKSIRNRAAQSLKIAQPKVRKERPKRPKRPDRPKAPDA